MKNLKLMLMVCLCALMTSCDYAQSNVQTLVTDDCGVSWNLVKAGQSIPRGVGMCHYKITIPDYPMNGNCKFRANFSEKVLADIEVNYDYTIMDGIKFVGEAKYLGKSNSDGEDESNSAKKYEMAENSVIDKRIIEVAANLMLKEDIVEFSQAEFEDKLQGECNKMLASLGVQINFLTFVPIPSEQTKQAIDVATAAKIYKSKGLEDVGKAVMAAHAGATRMNIETKLTPPAE